MTADNDRTITAWHIGGLITILLLGLWLRTIGFSWGLPTPAYYQTQTFYPDEQLIFITLKGMDPAHGKFRPSAEGAMLAMGPCYPYMVGVTAWIAQKIGFVQTASDSSAQKSVTNVRHLYELGRGVNVALGILTIIVLFFFVSNIDSPNAGLVAALILGILPMHVYFCQTMARDISQLFFWMMSLYFLSRVRRLDEALSPGFAGFCLGLSAACKYSSVLLGLSLPIGLWFIAQGEKSGFARFIRSRGLIFCLLGIPAGYLAGNPYSLWAFPDFLREFGTSLRAVSQLQGSDAFQLGGGWRFFGAEAWRFGCGAVMSVFFLIGFLRSFFRREPWDWVLWAAVIPYVAVNMASHARFVRYLMPLLPAAIYWVSHLVKDFWTRASEKPFFAWRRALLISSLCLVVALTGRYSWAFACALDDPDTRILSSDWIRDHIPAGSSVATAATPYFHHPSIICQQFWNPETLNGPKLHIINLEFSSEILREKQPDYIVLSDYDYFPLLTMKGSTLQTHPRFSFLEEIFHSGKYLQIQKFDSNLSFFRSTGDRPLFPHDWRYPFPSIIIFERADLMARHEGKASS